MPNIYRWLNIDNVNYLDTEDINGVNLFTYCNNNPVMYSDGDGHMPKLLAWILSGAAIVTGVILTATGVGGVLGGVLIGAGAGALIGGYSNETTGGSFDSGFLGGAITGAIGGLFAGFATASLVSSLTAVKCGAFYSGAIFAAQGLGMAFIGGMAGNYIGTAITAIGDILTNRRVDFGASKLTDSIGTGLISAGMSMFPSVEINKTSSVLERILAVISATMSESGNDGLSMLIQGLMNMYTYEEFI